MPISYQPDPDFVQAAHEYLSVLKSLKSAHQTLSDGFFELAAEPMSIVQESSSRLLSRGDLPELSPALLSEIGPRLNQPLPETELFSIHQAESPRVTRLVVRLPGVQPASVAAYGLGAISVWDGSGYTDIVNLQPGDPIRYLADNRVDLLARAVRFDYREGKEVTNPTAR